ncbi:hypothetical protein FNV43_RR07379 [Rhamnella rubrinervis]|uniref:Uncharacterized protein n=1 Tax=Rhamnella rubrinervis TaxID=2594499 RepID=A0A8K0HFM9_9ROSA|nr:hypothetical protein FNV43_RR07379 [Rhamnella rubrinervis]
MMMPTSTSSFKVECRDIRGSEESMHQNINEQEAFREHLTHLGFEVPRAMEASSDDENPEESKDPEEEEDPEEFLIED